MRRIADRLERALDFFVLDFVDHQRQDNRDREPQHQAQDADRQRVFQDHREPIGMEQPVELLEPNPWAAEHPLFEAVIFERNDDPVHRFVREDDEANQRRQHHDVQLPMPNLRPAPMPDAPRVCCHSCEPPSVVWCPLRRLPGLLSTALLSHKTAIL